MQGWNSLYVEPTALAADWAHHRIYAAASYEGIRNREDAPIVIAESIGLAQFCPICWRMIGAEPVLVALLSLLPGGRGHHPAGRALLPLALQAYPFVVPDAESFERQELLIDKVIADQPTDIGAPITLENGRLSQGALQRAKTVIQIGRAISATNALSQALTDAGLLEPWPLRFDLGNGLRVDRLDLMTIAAARLGDPVLFEIIESHGANAGLFLGLQRLSLFRINVLLRFAKSAARAAAAEARA